MNEFQVLPKRRSTDKPSMQRLEDLTQKIQPTAIELEIMRRVESMEKKFQEMIDLLNQDKSRLKHG